MSNNWNNRLPRIFAFPWIMAPFLSEKNNDRFCYYLKKYGILHTFHIILISVILNGRCHGNIKFWSNYLTIVQTIIPSNIMRFLYNSKKARWNNNFLRRGQRVGLAIRQSWDLLTVFAVFLANSSPISSSCNEWNVPPFCFPNISVNDSMIWQFATRMTPSVHR